MSKKLRALLKGLWGRTISLGSLQVIALAQPKMTSEQLEAQRISWVYGNCKMSNPDITREMVAAAVNRVSHHE